MEDKKDAEVQVEESEGQPRSAVDQAASLREMGLANHHRTPRSFGK
jgi:hypothetical protein